MLRIERTSSNRIEIEVEGSVDADTMRTGLQDFIAQSEDIANGQILYIMPEFSLPTLSAIGVKMGELPKLFGMIGKFDRCAVVTDAGWIRTAAGIEGALFPGIDVKGFPMEDRAAAEAWLAEGKSGAATA